MAVAAGDRQQLGEQRNVRWSGAGEHGFELVESDLCGVVAGEAGGAFELRDERVEGLSVW